jgi:hypothetical protein
LKILKSVENKKLLLILSNAVKVIATTLVLAIGMYLLYDAFGSKLVTMKRSGTVQKLPAGFQYVESNLVDSNGVHVPTGLMFGPGLMVVQKHCLACHSSKLIAQSRATREGWLETIRWMQATQKLWDLGEDETTVLDYLATYYAPEDVGRRANLEQGSIHWYELTEK